MSKYKPLVKKRMVYVIYIYQIILKRYFMDLGLYTPKTLRAKYILGTRISIIVLILMVIIPPLIMFG